MTASELINYLEQYKPDENITREDVEGIFDLEEQRKVMREAHPVEW